MQGDLNPEFVRLELIKTLIPTASRHSLTSDEIVETAGTLEKYVLGYQPQSSDGSNSVPSVKETLSAPRKGKRNGEGLPEFMTPTIGQVSTPAEAIDSAKKGQ